MDNNNTNIRVLVVEDNEDVKKIVCVYLKSKGFEVFEAGDGQIGLDMALRLRPDVILLDVLLPKLDGIEALQSLRSSSVGETIPVVMMSAVLQTRDIISETRALNVSSFLQKPFQVRQLMEHVHDALQKRRPVKNIKLVQPQRPDRIHDDARAVTFNVGPPTHGVEKQKKIVCKTEMLPAKGDLLQYPLPKILHSVFYQHLTGKLRVLRNAVEKRVYFQNGFPIYSESSLAEETLGAYLVDSENITQQQHEIVKQEMENSGRRYGEILLAHGFLGPHELFVALEAHLAEKIVGTFSWFDGRFVFESGDKWKEQIIVARMSPGRIILDGILQHWSSDRIKQIQIMRDTNVPFVLADSPYSDADLRLTTLEARVWQLVKQNIPIFQVLLKTSSPSHSLKTLFFFYVVGMIGFRVSQKGAPVQISTNEEIPVRRPFARKKENKSSELSQGFMNDYVQYRNANHFELLGVKKDSPIDAINQAYWVKKDKYHPDRLQGIEHGLVHEKVEELNMLVHRAYATLINPRTKKKYIDFLEKQQENTMLSPPRTQKNVALSFSSMHKSEAIQSFEKGFSWLRDGEYDKAILEFSEAESKEVKPKYTGYRIWATFLATKISFPAAEKELKLLAKENSENPTLFYLLGSLYLKENKKSEAIFYFEKVLSLDEQHIDAARQLRLIRMRSNSEASGLFDLLKLKK